MCCLSPSLQDLKDVSFVVEAPSQAATLSSAEPEGGWRQEERQLCWQVSSFKRGKTMRFAVNFTMPKEDAERRGTVRIQFACDDATLTGALPRLGPETDGIVAPKVRRRFISGEYIIASSA